MYMQQDTIMRGKPENIRPEAMKILAKNMLFGWWSPMSLVLNPYINARNMVRLSKYEKEWDRFYRNPKLYIHEEKTGVNSKRQTDKLVKVIYILLTLLGIVIAAAMIVSMFN